jgi:hypothetical protein
MFKIATSIVATGFVAILSSTPAIAAVPTITLTFTNPSVTVTPTEEVPIWVTLTVNGAPLTFDQSETSYPFGFDPDIIPKEAYGEPFVSYSSFGLFTYRYCNDEVGDGCSPKIYSFEGSTDPAYWFNIPTQFSMAADESRNFIVNSLVPVDGFATPGSYKIFNVGLGVQIGGYAADGTYLSTYVFFTVNVLPVPEPKSVAMLFGGLGLLGFAARRYKS